MLHMLLLALLLIELVVLLRKMSSQRILSFNTVTLPLMSRPKPYRWRSSPGWEHHCQAASNVHQLGRSSLARLPRSELSATTRVFGGNPHKGLWRERGGRHFQFGVWPV
jgi:hypothetical protein